MGLMRTYMKHRMTVFHPTGRDPKGAATGVATPDVPCRITYGNRMVRNAAGELVQIRAEVATEHPVAAGDTLTLPDGTVSKALDWRSIDGLGGREDHREVYL